MTPSLTHSSVDICNTKHFCCRRVSPTTLPSRSHSFFQFNCQGRSFAAVITLKNSKSSISWRASNGAFKVHPRNPQAERCATNKRPPSWLSSIKSDSCAFYFSPPAFGFRETRALCEVVGRIHTRQFAMCDDLSPGHIIGTLKSYLCQGRCAIRCSDMLVCAEE